MANRKGLHPPLTSFSPMTLPKNSWGCHTPRWVLIPIAILTAFQSTKIVEVCSGCIMRALPERIKREGKTQLSNMGPKNKRSWRRKPESTSIYFFSASCSVMTWTTILSHDLSMPWCSPQAFCSEQRWTEPSEIVRPNNSPLSCSYQSFCHSDGKKKQNTSIFCLKPEKIQRQLGLPNLP